VRSARRIPGTGTMDVTLALAGDTMLGRGVARRLRTAPAAALFGGGLLEVLAEADLVVLNLECCISGRGRRWPDPRKPFFFRAPPAAVEALALLGVDCVTLANNHALDYGSEALLDTLEHLRVGGITAVGAGVDERAARQPAVLTTRGGFRLGVVGVSDHPAAYAAGPAAPGVAYADLRDGVPSWLREAVAGLPTDAVLVTPHWGPNMAVRPRPYVRTAAGQLLAAGATLVAGHSAHVFHGVEGRVLYDLGDFVDDYRVDPELRNDLGILALVTLDEQGPRRLEAVPLRLDFCRTDLARGADADWVRRRLRAACEELDTEVDVTDGRVAVSLR
jgi:poly-gamma-glutamate capsule biosynthesis protein CapA/YwtB (metallophosphatase superfamily)